MTGADSVAQAFDRRARSFDALYRHESRLSRSFNRLLRKAVYERYAIALEKSGDV